MAVMPMGGYDTGMFGNTGISWPILGCQLCGALVPADEKFADHPDWNYPHENKGHVAWHASMGQRWPA